MLVVDDTLFLLVAGHGGVFEFDGRKHSLTAGYKSPSVPPGIFAGEFNRKVCQVINDHPGINTHFINPGIDNMTRKQRVWIACKMHAATVNRCVMVEVHVNAGDGDGWSKSEGSTIFHSENASKRSKRLAHMIDDELAVNGQKSRGVKPRNFNVLYNTTCPAVIVSCDFMTNLKQAQFMASRAGPIFFGRMIAAAITKFGMEN